MVSGQEGSASCWLLFTGGRVARLGKEAPRALSCASGGVCVDASSLGRLIPNSRKDSVSSGPLGRRGRKKGPA